MIFKLLTWIIFILIHNYIDYRITRYGNKPPYIQYYLLRGAAAILHGAWIIRVDMYCTQSYSCLIFAWLPLLIYQVCSFWIIYDLVRNTWSHKELIYRDTVERDSGIIEKVLSDRTTLYMVFKIIAFVSAILAFIVTYHQYSCFNYFLK